MDATISTLINELGALRLTKKLHEHQVKQTNEKIQALERQLIEQMDANGILESKNEKAKVSIQESVYPHVEQWDQFSSFILDNGYLHLLEKRPAVLAYRELLQMGKSVPGVLPFTKRKLTYRES